MTMFAFARYTLLLAIAVCSSGLSQARPKSLECVAGPLPEARMRKLHLVRPDLVSYPLATEIFC
jgi:hypothetical protein